MWACIAFEHGYRSRQERFEGRPQGGPLSPLLANVLPGEVDWELERRGHRFARYADDSNVYVRSQKARERVLEGLRKLYDRLHLKVNQAKTAVARVYGRKFLGYCLRALQLKHWRRGTTIYRELRALGANRDHAAQVAGNARRWRHNSRLALNRFMPIAFFDRLGVPRLS